MKVSGVLSRQFFVELLILRLRAATQISKSIRAVSLVGATLITFFFQGCGGFLPQSSKFLSQDLGSEGHIETPPPQGGLGPAPKDLLEGEIPPAEDSPFRPVRPPATDKQACSIHDQWGEPACPYVRELYESGRGAGNFGDFYDNRDDAHAEINKNMFLQVTIMPRLGRGGYRGNGHPNQITLGNASLAFGTDLWRSTPRDLTFDQPTIDGLYQQYTKGNSRYFYPEHLDYDEVDHFHAHVPMMGVSQGSSASETDELQRFFAMLAALRPDTKKALRDAGLLFPTLEMLNRRVRVDSSAEYLTGQAHRIALDNTSRSLEMSKAAQSIAPNCVPPMAQIEVVEDTYTEARERHFQSPTSISRIYRGMQGTKRLRISAQKSYDLNSLPLTYHWSVLQGGAYVRISKLNASGSLADIEIRYHPQYEIDSPSGKKRTNRVDVALFVKNRCWYSAPAVVSSFTLNNEDRKYRPPDFLELLSVTKTNGYVHPFLK